MKPTRTRNPHYQSWLLRLWRDGASKPWHASLQSVATERIIHFANVEALFMFLETQLETNEDISAIDENDEKP